MNFRSLFLALIAWVLDVLIVGFAVAIAFILITGGGVFEVAGFRVRARSTGNPVIGILALASIRYWWLPATPLLAIPGFSIQALEAASLNTWRRLREALSTLRIQRAAVLVAIVSAASLAVRLLNACFYYGFFSGDDVEIHEMTFAALFDLDWPVWNLRSPFYPMLFIYPAQWVAVQLGFSDTATLVSVGRAVVACFSALTIVLLFVVARRYYGLPVGILAVFFLSISKLNVAFGSSELPRPVATLFVLGAFACLRVRGRRSAATSGALLGIAASMRFSEGVFLLPALVEVTADRRWRDAVLMATGFLLTTAVIFGLGDWRFWGTPFYSLTNAVDYTLVQGLSSRGYQPFHYYLTHVTDWTNYFALSLALAAAWLGFWRATLWWLLPLVVLSFLPHKEARYLLPTLPFLAVCAAYGLWELNRRLDRMPLPNAQRLALVLLAGTLGALVFELGGFRFRRTERDVDLARRWGEEWQREGAAIETPWRVGGSLYLRRAAVLVEVDSERLSEDGYLDVIASNHSIGWVLLSSRRGDGHVAQVLTMHGYAELEAAGSGYRVFHRLPPVEGTPPHR